MSWEYKAAGFVQGLQKPVEMKLARDREKREVSQITMNVQNYYNQIKRASDEGDRTAQQMKMAFESNPGLMTIARGELTTHQQIREAQSMPSFQMPQPREPKYSTTRYTEGAGENMRREVIQLLRDGEVYQTIKGEPYNIGEAGGGGGLSFDELSALDKQRLITNQKKAIIGSFNPSIQSLGEATIDRAILIAGEYNALKSGKPDPKMTDKEYKEKLKAAKKKYKEASKALEGKGADIDFLWDYFSSRRAYSVEELVLQDIYELLPGTKEESSKAGITPTTSDESRFTTL